MEQAMLKRTRLCFRVPCPLLDLLHRMWAFLNPACFVNLCIALNLTKDFINKVFSFEELATIVRESEDMTGVEENEVTVRVNIYHSYIGRWSVTWVCWVQWLLVGGVWATFPVLFPTATVGFYVHSVITVILSFNTLFNYCMTAFRRAGPSPSTVYGKYDLVDKKALEGYKFCVYCRIPKPPNAHHCRSCESCVVDMDHHCPFVNNLTLVSIFHMLTFLQSYFVFGNQNNHLGWEFCFKVCLYFL